MSKSALGMLRQRLEGMAAGMAAGTILTFAGASFGQLSAPTDTPSQHGQPGLRLTSSGFALGGLAGLLSPGLLGAVRLSSGRRRQRVQSSPVSDSVGGAWSGWRDFVVRSKHSESAEITSFELEPVDGPILPMFLPGQFLTLQLEIPGQPKPVLRTYSLSDYPAPNQPIDHYRLSIKREPAPQGLDVPPGLASNFLHDHVEEGSSLRVRPPAGSFVLDTSSTKAIVLISNGVGITPMVTMVKAALQQPSPRSIWFLHGCRNGTFHAFRREITELADAHPNLHLHIAYSRPSEADAGHFQSEGYVDGALVRSLISQDADYFLCGSPPFMEGLIAELQAAGIAERAIHFEMFSSAPRSTTQASTPQASAERSNAEAATITFARSGQSATWGSTDPDDTLLAFAEAQGLEPPFACRAGVCGTCACRVLEGEVRYISEPTAAVAQGSALICIARPESSSISLEL